MISVYKQGKLIFVSSDELEGLITMYDGWTPTVKPALPTKAQLVAMRDFWLERGHEGTAAAIDNAIELIEKSAEQELQEVQAKPIEAYNCETTVNLAEPHYIVTPAWAEKHLNSLADLEKMGDGKTELSNNGT
jgi:hypothetical protein